MSLLVTQKFTLTLLLLLPFITDGGFHSAPLRVVASFGGECMGGKVSVSKPLTSLIQRLRRQTKYPCEYDLCDGAFSYDLNGDKRPEYFVRLTCGATGNCTWGVFSDKPAKIQARFTAWFVYIHKPKAGWAILSTYTREGGTQGVIGKLAYRHGKYRLTSERLDDGTFDNPQPYLKKMGVPKCG